MSASRHTRFAQRDANHDEVRQWYEALFCHVVDTHALGFGFPDFVISVAQTWDLVEVKTGTGEPTPAQLRFIRDAKARVVIVRDQNDVVEHVARLRLRAAQRPPEPKR